MPNLGVARFLIQLVPEEVEAEVELVTANTRKSADTKKTLYVDEVEEEEVEKVGEGSVDAPTLWKPSCSRTDVRVDVCGGGGGMVCIQSEVIVLMVSHGLGG